MFQDERINTKVGIAYKNGILLATIISIIYLVLKLGYSSFSIINVLSESFIIITGIIILLIGIINFNSEEKDERISYLKLNYYQKAAKVFLSLSLLGFAIAIPLVIRRTVQTSPLNLLFTYLQLAGFAYFSLVLKKEKIYFNYSFVESEKGYYKRVFLNILKLVLLILGIYGVSAFITFFVFSSLDQILRVLLVILIAFLISAISLSLNYLCISLVERVSYKSILNNKKYLHSHFIVGALMLLVVIGTLVISIKIAIFDPNAYSNSNITAALYIASLVSVNNYLYQYSLLLSSILFTSIFMQFSKKIKGITTIVIINIVSILIALFSTQISYILMINSIELVTIFAKFKLYINIFIEIITLLALLLISLTVRNENDNKHVIIAPIARIIGLVVLGMLLFVFQNVIVTENANSFLVIRPIVYFVPAVILIISIMLIKTDKNVFNETLD